MWRGARTRGAFCTRCYNPSAMTRLQMVYVIMGIIIAVTMVLAMLAPAFTPTR